MIEVAGIPVVESIDSQSPCLDIAVGFDNSQAARQMTTAIIARGIATLPSRRTFDERTIIKQKGYEQAMLDAGLVPYSVMVEQSSSTLPVLNSFAGRGGNIRSWMACSVLMMIRRSARRLMSASGVKSSDHMAIAGSHGHDIGQVMEPRLASVLTPRERMVSIGADACWRVFVANLYTENVRFRFHLVTGGLIKPTNLK